MTDRKPGAPSPDTSVVLYRTEDGRSRVQVRLDAGTALLTQAAMAELFQTTPQNITLHLRSIYAEGELDEEATCKHYLQVQTEGGRRVQRTLRQYSLDAILAVGYRVRSPRGTHSPCHSERSEESGRDARQDPSLRSG